MARKTAFSILFIGFIVAGASFFSSTVHAQTKIIDGVSDPKNVTGLTSCTTVASSFIKSTFNTSCGDTFTQPGSFAIGDPLTGNTVPYDVGDIAKCTWTPFTSSAACVVSHKDGTYTTYNTSGVSGALTTTQLDSKGNPIGTPDQQSTLDAVAIKPVVNAASSVLSGIGNEILKAVGSTILTFANFLLGVAGVLFNLVMFYGVFQFANTIGNAPGVLTAWGILRDLANMALLFGFIFMGIATILDTGAVQGFTAKNALPKLLIFAVLMNFSLFTCEAMIDVSNALASSMYTQSNTSPCASNDTKCVVNYGLAGHIMQSTGLGGIWAVTAKGDVNLGPVQYLGLALFATVGAIVFFAASIMLAIRVIVLTFLMIVSPIGFAGMAIPPLQKFAGDWWQRVIHQAFYAPIMLLLILISLKVSDSFTNGQYAGVNNALGGTIGNVVTDPNASTISVVLVFMLIIGFMVASLIIANRFGAAGATAAVGFAKNRVLGIYSAASGFAGRNTIGRAGSYAQKRYEAWAGNEKNKVLAPLFRNNTLLLHDAATATIGAVKDAKFGGKRTFEEAKQVAQKRTSHLEHASETAIQKEELATAIENKDDKTVARILQQMNANDIKQTDYVKKSAEGIDILARNLSPDKFDDMMKDKEMEADQKEHLINGRFAQLSDQIDRKEAGEIRKWSPKDLEQLAKYKGDVFEKLISAELASGDSLISNDQFDKLKDSNSLTNTQKQSVKENAMGGKIERALSADDTVRATNLMKFINGNKNRAKLPAKILTNPALAKNFSVSQLLAIATEDKLSEDDQKALAGIVQSRRATEPEIDNIFKPGVGNPVVAAYYTP